MHVLKLCAATATTRRKRRCARLKAACALVLLLSSHPGRTENGIVFPGLAAHRCVDEPERDITCTAEQLSDIALLDIPVAESTDTYSGQIYEPEFEDRLHLRSGSGGKALLAGRYAP